MKQKLVFVTNNSHKLREVKEILDEKFDIVSLNDLGIDEEIPETADTLEGNALQKARFVHSRTQLNCFADDTGLEVEALEGAPGVYSARYAGENASFDDNMNKLLDALGENSKRKASFRTAIALILDDAEYLFEGSVEGIILNEKHGIDGFGYDPVFQPIEHNQSFAEMEASLKNSISHRGRAVKKLALFLLDKNE
ncbi:MAG: non-canonical purine NTP diphosphatase [Bacteroidales bacterium]|nr:non-canonical purine NTP diphosphatase [Bacteroidales bacterium]